MGIRISAGIKQRFLGYVRDVVDSGNWSIGEQAIECERLWSELTGLNCLTTSNGTTALELAVRSSKKAGGVFLVPVMIPPMVAWAVEAAGFSVEYMDVDPALGVVGPSEFSYELEQHHDVVGVVFVHNAGVIHPEIEMMVAMARERGVFVVEDCSHAHGCELRGKKAGSFGDAAAWSFYPTKVLITAEGGIVGFSQELGTDALADAMVFANQGKERGSGKFGQAGYNLRLGELAAALMRAEIECMDEIVADRQAVADAYDDAGAELVQRSVDGLVSTFYKYTILADGEVLERLEANGVRFSGDTYKFVQVARQGEYPGAFEFAERHQNLAFVACDMDANKANVDSFSGA